MIQEIETYDIILPTLKSSVGIDKMNWYQVHHERWATSPISNTNPCKEMLEEGGLVIPRNICDEPYHPMSKGVGRKSKFHTCYITFDRSYVIWWFSQRLKELVDADNQLLDDIAEDCGHVFSTKKLELDDLKTLARVLGYRIHKIEPKKSKNANKSISFKITN